MGCFSSCFSFSALFPLCVLPTAVLCCPLQSRASFCLLSPSFTEFGNLIFAACLSSWRLLTVTDICIHIFLSCALSTVILWLYWIPSTSLRTFHGYRDRHTPSASGFCWLRDGWSSYLRLLTSVSASRRCSHTLASNLTTSCCFNTTHTWVKRTWNPSVPNPLFPDWCGIISTCILSANLTVQTSIYQFYRLCQIMSSAAPLHWTGVNESWNNPYYRDNCFVI